MQALFLVIGMLAIGATSASADTHTGYVLTITCGSTETTVVSPTSPAAASQDISSTRTVILAVGALYAPTRFPAGKIVLCDIYNQTTNDSYSDLPFLVKSAP